MTQNVTLPHYDASFFNTQSYAKKIDKPWGYEIHWVAPESPYMGKILHINEGCRLSLQMHDKKQESWLIIKGSAAVIWEDNEAQLIQTDLQTGQGYSTKIGQRHRLIGLTDCDIVEVSTPEAGTTWRLEDDYSRPHETPQQRVTERNVK